MATVSPSSSTVDIWFIHFLLFLHRVPLPVTKNTICLYIHVKVPKSVTGYAFDGIPRKYIRCNNM